MSGPRRSLVTLVGLLAALAVLAVSAAAASRGAGQGSAPGAQSSRVSPVHDPNGLHRGLSPVPADDKAAALELIGQLSTAPATSLAGYDREKQFGPAWTDDQGTRWGHDHCPTREEVLHRDLTALHFRKGSCVVTSGTLRDPYTAQTIAFTKTKATAVQIDHLAPLAYAWTHGAKRWTQTKRERFANDPLNLLAVDGPTNESKGDQGPGEWLPPNPKLTCAYSVRFAQVADRYKLTVTAADSMAMDDACS